jgi:hypothetical protein
MVKKIQNKPVPSEAVDLQPASEGLLKRSYALCKKHAHFFSGGIFLLAIVSVSVLNFSKTAKGDEAIFLPAVCEGDWAYMENIQGASELGADALFGDFNTTNSALHSPDSMQLNCGSFIGSLPEKIAVDRMSLHLSWAFGSKIEAVRSGQIGYERDKQDELDKQDESTNKPINELTNQPNQLTEPAGEPSNGGAGADVNPSESTNQQINESTNQQTEPAGEPVDRGTGENVNPSDSTNQQINESTNQPTQQTPESSAVPTGFRISSFDESVPAETPAPLDQPLPENPTVEPVDNLSPEQVVAPAEKISDQPPVETVPEETVVIPAVLVAEPMPETSAIAPSEPQIDSEKYFSIEYSVGNGNWETMAEVGMLDFSRDFGFQIPSADDLQNLQIRIRTLNPLPADLAVFLDGMFLGLNNKLGDDDFYIVEMQKQALDFSTVEIIDVKAADGTTVAVKIKNAAGEPQVWIFDITDETKTGYLLDSGNKLDAETHLSAKNGDVFWLAGDNFYGFDAVGRRFVSKPRNLSEEQSELGTRYSVKGLNFQIIVRNGEIYFYSDTAGELFSDDNSEVKEKFGKIFLDYLNENKDDVLEQQIMPNIVNEN